MRVQLCGRLNGEIQQYRGNSSARAAQASPNRAGSEGPAVQASPGGGAAAATAGQSQLPAAATPAVQEQLAVLPSQRSEAQKQLESTHTGLLYTSSSPRD